VANVNYKKGDKVRVKSIKSRQGWTLPKEHHLVGAEGNVIRFVEPEDFFAAVMIEKSKCKPDIYVNTNMTFRAEELEKI
jgi:hypothetical protein